MTDRNAGVVPATPASLSSNHHILNSHTDMPSPELREILTTESVKTVFQPLISVKRGAVFGMEALARGICPATGATLSPMVLFGMAETQDERLLLDRLCRKRALEAFAKIHKKDRSLLLSLNLDIGCLSKENIRRRNLLQTVRELGIRPNNIIIEIVEDEAADMEAVLDLVSYYRDNDFLIALDDVGAGHSNLDRIPLIKPDVLKMDRSLISGIHEHFHKQEVAKCLVRMGGCVGARVLAEGIETQEEALCLLELGVDAFQGFYFARPADPEVEHHGLKDAMRSLGVAFRKRATEQLAREKEQHAWFNLLVERLVNSLENTSQARFGNELAEFVTSHTELECVYVLDSRGVQVSPTICNPEKLKRSRMILFEPARVGADHSLKDYYLPIQAGLTKFTTDPYISQASGNRCITISTQFAHVPGNEDLILCVDMDREC